MSLLCLPNANAISVSSRLLYISALPCRSDSQILTRVPDFWLLDFYGVIMHKRSTLRPQAFARGCHLLSLLWFSGLCNPSYYRPLRFCSRNKTFFRTVLYSDLVSTSLSTIIPGIAPSHTNRIVLEHAERTGIARSDESLVVARHGHGEEAHGDGAGFG